MKTNLYYLLALGSLLSGFSHAEPAQKHAHKSEQKLEKKEVAAKSGISSSVNNGKGEVIYNGKSVWKGKVKKDLRTYSDANGETTRAAAIDGKKVVWELNKGDGEFFKNRKK